MDSSIKKEVSLFDNRESIAVLRRCNWLFKEGDESTFECLPCSSNDKFFHSRDLDVDPSFVYMYETFIHRLGLKLHLTNSLFSAG